MLRVADAEYWAKRRWEYIEAARACRAVLTRSDGYWKYAPDDPRVKDAVGIWINRARAAHAFALGRRPVIENFVMINDGEARHGSLYAMQQH